MFAGVLLTLCLILAIGVTFYFKPTVNEPKKWKEIAGLYSENISSKIDKKFKVIEEALRDPSFQKNDKASLKLALVKLSMKNEFHGGVYALDEKGIMLAQSTPNHPSMKDLTGNDFSYRSYFIDSHRYNKTIVTNVFLSANRKEQIVVIASPRQNKAGEFIGIIDGVLDVATSGFSAIAEEIHNSKKYGIVDLYLLDDIGIVIASNNKLEIAKPFINIGLFNRFRHNSPSKIDLIQTTHSQVYNTPYHVLAIRRKQVE